MNESIVRYGDWIGTTIWPIIQIIFSLLTLFVLVYYVRRRYSLCGEIKRIPQGLLYKESYRNHLKNLKLRCVIHNFIILVLAMELTQSIGFVVYSLPYFLMSMKLDILSFNSIDYSFQKYLTLLNLSIMYSLVPVLSMIMDFLWLAYRKYEYKYTLIRWACYIAVRILVFVLLSDTMGADNYEFNVLIRLLTGLTFIVDYIQYVYYSRKFYLHLKSREKEIRLFYFDKRAYLDIKFIRFHFKIATILVSLALFFRSTGIFVNSFFRGAIENMCFLISDNCRDIGMLVLYIVVFIVTPFRIFSTIIFTFNYLYMFIVIVYKSYRDKQKLANINKHIKPIVQQYHNKFYSRYSNYC